MKAAGRPSWQMRVDEPEDLHLVLFVRDACRLEVATEAVPPRLIPAVPEVQAALSPSARAAAARAWPHWWAAALDAHRTNARPLPEHARRDARFAQLRQRRAPVDRPAFPSLQHVPELQQATRHAADAFNQWWQPPLSRAHARSVRKRRRRGHRGLGLPGVKCQLIDLHHGRGTEQRVVRHLEAELHRRVQPFDLAIDVLAVTTPPVIWRDEHYTLISSALLADENAYHDWLLSTVRPLA